MRYLLGAAMAALVMGGLVMGAGAASAQQHDPTPAEEAVIVHYRTAMNAVIDAMAPGSGWQERVANRMDIPDNPPIYGNGPEPFYFDGTITRMYESASTAEDPSVKMTALTQELYAPATAPARRKAIIAEIQKLAQVQQQPQAGPRDLLITTADNMGYVAPASDQATLVADPPAGVARLYKEPAHQVENADCYVLEFGDPSRYYAKDDATWYHYSHTDASPHIETIEITLQGPQDVIDAIVRTTDWTKVQAILNP